MNRKLILIISDGGGDSPLRGVKLDEIAYLNFFKSPEGGAWRNSEIFVFNNNFRLENLSRLASLKDENKIDYFLIVYCGHGYTDENGQIHFEVRPDCDLLLHDIVNCVSETRCLIIADSCRTVCRLDEGGNIRRNLFSQANNDNSADYVDLCRNLYNSCILLTNKTELTILFADSYNETASENNKGGIYSYSLLAAAQKIIKDLRLGLFNGRDIFSAIYCHNMAEQRVKEKSFYKQNPEILYRSRGRYQFPFVVVPSLSRQLGD